MDSLIKERGDSQKTRILLVEDESIVALDIQNRLASLGYEIVGHAVSGPEAIDLASKLLPALILMDIKLRGEMDGIDAAMVIHDTLSIPIVFLTAYSDLKTLERAKLTEPFGYLLKPFQKQELLIAIEIGLYKHEMTVKLKESERWRNAILTSIGEGLIALDADERVKFLNPAAEGLIGWTSAEAMGLSAAKVFPERRPEGVPENRSLLAKKDGRIFPIEKQINLILDDKGAHQGSVVVFRDITDQVSYEEELKTAKYVAEVANKAKSDFIANMTHELRTPLNSIIGMADIIKDWDVGREQRDFVEILHTSAHSLMFLINSILDFSKIEAGKMEVGDAAFNLHDALGEAAEKLGIQAGRKGLDLNVRIAPDVPAFVGGDRKLFDHILLNLLGNAVKFTDRGEVEIRARVDRIEELRTHIAFSIRDTGIGIPKEKIESIFDPFSQLDGSLTRNYGGTGLGLAITRRMVRILGGTIEVASEEGRGSEFKVVLPFRPVPAAEKKTSELSGWSFVLWMGSEKNRDLLADILRQAGADVALAGPEDRPEIAAPASSNQVLILDELTFGLLGKSATPEIGREEPSRKLVLVLPLGHRRVLAKTVSEILTLYEPLWGNKVVKALNAHFLNPRPSAAPVKQDQIGSDKKALVQTVEKFFSEGDLARLESFLQSLKAAPESAMGGYFYEMIFRLILALRKGDEEKLRSLIDELKRNTL